MGGVITIRQPTLYGMVLDKANTQYIPNTSVSMEDIPNIWKVKQICMGYSNKEGIANHRTISIVIRCNKEVLVQYNMEGIPNTFPGLGRYAQNSHWEDIPNVSRFTWRGVSLPMSNQFQLEGTHFSTNSYWG